MRRLQTLREAVGPGAPLLPRPVAYLPTLLMSLVETQQGERFSALIGRPEALEAAHRLGVALAALHETRVELGKTRSLQQELESLEKRVQGLSTTRPELGRQARELLDELLQLGASLPPRTGPVLSTLTPHQVLYCDEQIVLSEVHDLRLSHPLLDLGRFLARLSLLGLTRNDAEEVSRIAAHLRASYAERSGIPAEELGPFEAEALTRLACARAERQPPGRDAGISGQLLACASARLAADRSAAELARRSLDP
jgi:hypothetical protein